MIRFFKYLFLLSLIAIIVLLVNFIREENPAVKSLPVIIESKIHTQGGTYVPLSKIPFPLQQAVIDTEDRSFYTNPGVSFAGILRSLVRDLSSQSIQEGGSTITQQLAKNQLLNNEKIVSRKFKEIILAFMITKNYSKQDILSMYLNSIYFGHGAWGVDSAARIYFKKPVSELSLGQATLLAGLPQSPSYFDPFDNYQAARLRQSEVIQSMIEAGDLTQDMASKIIEMPLELRN